MTGFGFPVSGFGFRVSGFQFRVSGFGFRIPGFGFRVSGFGCRVSSFGCRVTGFGFRVRVPSSGVRVPGSGFRVPGSGVEGFDLVADVFDIGGHVHGLEEPHIRRPHLVSGLMVWGLGFRFCQPACQPVRGSFHSVDYEPFKTPEIHVVRDQNCMRNGVKVKFCWDN